MQFIQTHESLLIFAMAFLFDMSFGDPRYFLHPVRLIGAIANIFERRLSYSKKNLKIRGLFFWIFVQLSIIMLLIGLYFSIKLLPYNEARILFFAFLLYSTFAVRDMIRHVHPVLKALSLNNLKMAREALKFIVGRDTEKLSGVEIIKAATESLAESFMDGFFSVIFWYFAGFLAGQFFNTDAAFAGILAVFFYRTANTLDSMVGYKNEKYKNFGFFSAKVDDVLNFIPARILILFMIFPVLFSGGSVKQCLKIFISDRKKSPSPNAAFAISIFSGALKIKLGGRASYGKKVVKKPDIGSDFIEPNIHSLRKAVNLFKLSSFFIFIVFGVIFLFLNMDIF